MFLISLLITTLLIISSKSLPLSYTTYQRKNTIPDVNNDIYYIPYLIGERKSSVNEIYWPQYLEDDELNINKSIDDAHRVKKIHSLSVTNSLDVLRQRVLLELARRKALQDQQQIDANRRFLNNIGKRSNTILKIEISPTVDVIKKHISDYQYNNNEQKNFSSEVRLQEILYWLNRKNLDEKYDSGEQLHEMDIEKIDIV